MNQGRKRVLSIVFSKQSGQPQPEFVIIADDSYTGKYFFCTAEYDDETVFGTWSITSGGSYATINENGRVDIVAGTQNKSITVQCAYEGNVASKSIQVSYDNQLSIEVASTLTGTSGNAVAVYNGQVVTPTWSITSGGSHASINSAGAITINSSGTITIQAVYSSYTVTKEVELIYESGKSSSTTVDEDGSVTTTETETTTDPSTGQTTETSTSTTVHEDGSQSSTNTETVTNPDGSYTSESTTNNQDGTSSQSSTTGASDGSSQTTTTNYNEEGNPTTGSNNTIDTAGNSNTQDITYNEQGESHVTGYTIDTSNNPGGSEPVVSLDTGLIVFDGKGFYAEMVFKCKMSENVGNNIFGAIQQQGNKKYAGFNLAVDANAKVNMYAGKNSSMYSSGAIGSNIHSSGKYWSISSSNNTKVTEYTYTLEYLPAGYGGNTSKYGQVTANLTPVQTSGSNYYQTNPFVKQSQYIPDTLANATFTLGGNGIIDTYDMINFEVVSFNVHKI